MENYRLALGAYQAVLKLEDTEIEYLSLFIKLAHAMHIILSTVQKIKHNNNSIENEHWLNRGREGLRFMGEITQRVLTNQYES